MQLEHYSVLIIPIFILFAYMYTGKHVYRTFLYGYILLGFILNTLLKCIFQEKRPDNTSTCTVLVRDDLRGFPSGHAQILALTATFWSLRVKHGWLLWIYVYMVARQRINSGCHTYGQVIGGLLIGTMSGIFLYNIHNF